MTNKKINFITWLDLPLALRQEIWVRDKFCKLSTNFCIDNELCEAILFQFPANFSLLYEKKLFFMDLKSFLEWAQSNSRSKGSTSTCKKAGNLA